MKGVTQRVYDAWRDRRGQPRQSVRHISQTEIDAIYRRDYWDRVRGDDLASGLDLAVFDLAVNSGVSRAAKMLQAVVGVPQDGIIGPATLRACAAHPNAAAELCDARLRFMKRLKTWPVFGKGWSARVADVKKKSMSMAKAAPKTKSVMDEVMDVIDWTQPHGEDTYAPPPPPQEEPHDTLHTYVVPAIVAFLGALAAQPWDNVLSDNPSISVSMIFMAAVSAAWKAAAPWWAKAVWSPKVA